MSVPTRAALYLRVSTGRQAESDLSIPDQRRQATAYCTGRGWEIAAEYVEPGASATDERRPEFQRMIDAATTKPAPFDVILVHSFSRFFRDQFQLEFYVRRLARSGVRLASITQELGDDPMSTMIRQIMALFDEYQSKENAKHVCGLEGECPAGLLERLAAAHRLTCRRGRAARCQDQEEAGDRPAPRRDGAADLSPRSSRRWRQGPDGREEHRQLSQPQPHLHARRRTLGHRPGPPHPDPPHLHGRARV